MRRTFSTTFIAASFSLVVATATLMAQPVIQSVYPPTLTQRVGDHLAFVTTASGSGALSYQWSFKPVSQPNILLAGQTSRTLVLTNIQTTNSGQYWVAVTDGTGTSSNFATLNVSAGYLALAGTNLVVARVGDGAEPLSQATGNTLYLDQYTTNGTYVSTVMIPDHAPAGVSGAGPALLVAGAGNDATYEAFLTISENKQFVNLAGYNENYPFGSSDVTLSSTHIRGIYEINTFGFYGLAYTNAGLYSGGQHFIRGSASSDGLTNFWNS